MYYELYTGPANYGATLRYKYYIAVLFKGLTSED
jgi:hypothetical protein